MVYGRSGDRFLDDPGYDDFFAAAAELGQPVFIAELSDRSHPARQVIERHKALQAGRLSGMCVGAGMSDPKPAHARCRGTSRQFRTGEQGTSPHPVTVSLSERRRAGLAG